MVSTRKHPDPFPPPELPPSMQSSSSPSTTKQSSPSKRSSKRASPSATNGASNGVYVHNPTKLSILWLVVSLPLVIWDTGYVLLRPHSMPGGKLHSPIWTPYALYGTIDYIYGWPAYNARNGFTGAQGTMNLVETIGYIIYLGLVFGYGTQKAQEKSAVARFLSGKELTGKVAASAALLMFAVNVMTLSKTVLYWLNEAFSGFHSIGHNDAATLFFLWIVPNGMWLVFPTYMIYAYGTEIVDALSGEASKKVQ